MDRTCVILNENGRLPSTVEAAWNKLADEREVDSTSLRPSIALSWRHCLELDLDPCHIKPIAMAPSEESKANNSLLLNVASKHLRQLYEILQGKDYFLMLISPEGYLLSMHGDRAMMSYAEKIGIVPGSDENVVVRGTTAATICLTQGTPTQVFWQEHYYEAHHSLCCSAAPLFLSNNRLMGVINVANRDPSAHSHQILSIVSMAAKLIESEMEYRVLSGDYDKSQGLLTSFVEATHEPTLIFDDRDQLVYCNKQAQRALGADAVMLANRYAPELITNYPLIKDDIAAGRQWAELQFCPQFRHLCMDAQIKKLSNSRVSTLGTVIILKNRVKQLPGTGKAHGPRYNFDNFIHRSREMAMVISDAKIMAATDHGILVEGESGTGKEVLAQAIHNESSRRDHPFVALNCAALPRDLIQSELFGYEKGAFTGAKRDGQIGKFEQANNGTIFLDEIGDMPLDTQVNLLRVLQEKMVQPIGGMQPKSINVRVIAATNKRLLQEVTSGNFRQDLYYRLSVMRLYLPPLRERPADLWALIRYFVELHSNGLVLDDIDFEVRAKRALEEYAWPGNIRELENAVIYMLTKIRNNCITPADLPLDLAPGEAMGDKIEDLQSLECQGIRKALTQCAGNISKTARFLGISKATLYRKIKKYSLHC